MQNATLAVQNASAFGAGPLAVQKAVLAVQKAPSDFSEGADAVQKATLAVQNALPALGEGFDAVQKAAVFETGSPNSRS